MSLRDPYTGDHAPTAVASFLRRGEYQKLEEFVKEKQIVVSKFRTYYRYLALAISSSDPKRFIEFLYRHGWDWFGSEVKHKYYGECTSSWNYSTDVAQSTEAVFTLLSLKPKHVSCTYRLYYRPPFEDNQMDNVYNVACVALSAVGEHYNTETDRTVVEWQDVAKKVPETFKACRYRIYFTDSLLHRLLLRLDRNDSKSKRFGRRFKR